MMTKHKAAKSVIDSGFTEFSIIFMKAKLFNFQFALPYIRPY